MQRRIYTILFKAVTVTAVQDLFYVKASSTNGLMLRSVSLSASAISASAEIALRIKRMPATVTVGSAGTAPTIQKVSSVLATAALSAARANDTTQSTTGGTAVELYACNWNVLQEFLYVPPTEEERPECLASEALVVDISATPASTVLSGALVFEET